MKKSLVLSQRDIDAALASLSRSPQLALGFESSALSAFGASAPEWSPTPGDQLPSKRGAYTVLASKAFLPGLAWPWLLCSKPSRDLVNPLPSQAPSGPLSHLSRLCLASAAALCFRPGHSRSVVNEAGERLRLISPERLAQAIARRIGSGSRSTLSSRLGISRAARARASAPLRPEISAELASLLRF